jgi:hypothetical protein
MAWIKANDASVKPASHKKFILNISLLLNSMVETSVKSKKCNMIMLDVPNIMKKYNVELCTSDVAEDYEY